MQNITMENKKIALIFIGAIRECKDFINENIETLKQCIGDNYDVTVFLSTWHPLEGTHITNWGVEYIFDYDLKELMSQTKNNVDEYLLFKQKDIQYYDQLKNGCRPLFMYQLNQISNHFKENHLRFDYIIKSRHDIKLEIKNIEKYFNNSINISPIHYNDGVPTHYTKNPRNSNDHFFICPYNVFLNFSFFDDKTLKEITSEASDNEHINYICLNMISTVGYLDWEDISHYTVRNQRFYVP